MLKSNTKFIVEKVNVCDIHGDHGIVELSGGYKLYPNCGRWCIDNYNVILKVGDEISFDTIENGLTIPYYGNTINVNGIEYTFYVGDFDDSYFWLIIKK